MRVLLAPTEPDACADRRLPEPMRRAAHVVSRHSRSPASTPRILPRPEPEARLAKQGATQ